MADYKRFVSYMYEYENGIKKKNVGYARVETSYGVCRCTLLMQLEGLADGIFPTYLIHRPTNEMDLVYLGDCSVENQIMDSRLSAKEFNIMDSGYRFSDMGGILLFLNSGVFYATQWDDRPVVLEEVLYALKPKSKSEVRVEKVPDVKETIAVAKIPPPSNIEIKTPEKKPTNVMPVLVKKPATAEPISVKKPMADASTSEADIAKKKEDRKAERPRYILPGGAMMSSDFLHSSPKPYTNPWDLVKRYKEAEDRKLSEIERKKAPEAPTVKHIVSKDIDNKETPLEKAVDDSKQSDNPLAARIFASFPRIYPFEDSEITRCVKVEPKDIGALPSDTWILSNNSFLLHGYYCYHHLIFAETSDFYGRRYMLGVPGIYHNRERFMARMFGFECFKSIRKRELKQGDFGYWYLEVNF